MPAAHTDPMLTQITHDHEPARKNTHAASTRARKHARKRIRTLHCGSWPRQLQRGWGVAAGEAAAVDG